MTLYSLNCERCDERTTHEEVWDHEDYSELSREHPRFDTTVVCRQCLQGRGKTALPDEGVEIWATARVEQGLSLRVRPDDIPDGVSLREHLEERLKERRGAIAREIADGIREGQVELGGIECEELDGFPPY